jgi:plastocyanin
MTGFTGGTRIGARLVRAIVVGALATSVACGGGSGSTPTQPSNTGGGTTTGGGSGGGTSTSTPTITITSSGVSPSEVTISPGQRVRFVNNNSIPHDMSSDPHPEHTDCPEINLVGFIQPTQTKETGNFAVVRTCGFHDHNQPTNDSLRGRIVIR